MTIDTPSENRLLDTTGLLCPEPVMLLHKAIRNLSAGQLIEVTATDPSTQRDIPKFCHFLGHKLVKQSHEEQIFYYWIEKV